MNTNNIYYGMLRGVTEADRKLDSFCTSIRTVSSVPVKSVLVLVTQPCKG